MSDKLLTVAQVAERLGVHASTVLAMSKDGRLVPTVLSRPDSRRKLIRFRPAVVDALVEGGAA